MPTALRQQAYPFGSLRKDPHWSVQGLVFYSQFSPAGMLFDESPFGNDGTITGPTWAGQGLDFAGGTDVITLPTTFKPLDGGTGFTVILRVKIDNIDADRGLFYTDEHAADDPIVFWYDSPNGWGTVLNTSMGAQGPNYGNTANVGQWYHLALWWDGVTFKLFVDGVEDSGITRTLGGTLDVSLTAYSIGNDASAQEKGMDGIISNVSIYTRPLLVSEIQALALNSNIPMQQPPIWLFSPPPVVGVTPKGPLGHPFHGPFGGPLAA